MKIATLIFSILILLAGKGHTRSYGSELSALTAFKQMKLFEHFNLTSMLASISLTIK
ncbi:hypothetical protein [Dyadobacter psychrophilus]|uniref:hypothetical protein n=1 Tax=Dyadobacter psychrophilus TaxID=651661 RepID=UPI00148359B1|nr:hypothetical protein [Dyadobacter psychrophilus]